MIRATAILFLVGSVSPVFAAVNAMFGVTISTSSTIMGVTPVGAIMGQTAASGGGSAPAFDAENNRTTNTFNGNATEPFPFAANVGTGKRVVLIVLNSGAFAVSSAVDDAGNTWIVDGTNTDNGGVVVTILSAPVTSAITSGENVTVTFDSAGNHWRAALIVTLNNTTAKDVTGTPTNAFNTTISTSASTSAATATIGVVSSPNVLVTTSTDGTQSGACYTTGAGSVVLVYKDSASSGTVSTGITIASSLNLGSQTIAYK